MTPARIATPRKESPLLFEGLTWREFKAVEQLLDRPGYRLSFLDGFVVTLHSTKELSLCLSFREIWHFSSALIITQTVFPDRPLRELLV